MENSLKSDEGCAVHTAKFDQAKREQKKVTLPVLRPEEVSLLFTDDLPGTENIATDLAELALRRQMGVWIDLGVESAARAVVLMVKEKNTQHHNTIAVTSSITKPIDVSGGYSKKKVLCTPNDPNTPVTSIDFGTSKVRASHLDLERISNKAGIVEKTFLAQLSVVQALHHMGCNTKDLEEHVSRASGVSFVKEIIEKIAVSNIANMEKWLAQGGRPSPAILLSHNSTTAMQVLELPRVSVKDINVENFFFARCKVAAQFILMMSNSIAGLGSYQTLTFNCNHRYASKFRSAMIAGLDCLVDNEHAPKVSIQGVAGSDSLANFMRMRQSAKMAKVTSNREAMMNDVFLRALTGFNVGNPLAATGTGYFGGLALDDFARVETNMGSEGSKITTVLFEYFHVETVDSAEIPRVAQHVCLELLGLAYSGKMRNTVLTKWGNLVHSKGMGKVFATCGWQKMSVIVGDLETMFKVSWEPRRLAQVFMLIRHLTHTMLQLNMAYKKAATACDAKVASILIKYILKQLSTDKTCRCAPFTYTVKFNATMKKSVLVPPPSLDDFRNVMAKASAASTVENFICSNARRAWKAHYVNLAKGSFHAATLLGKDLDKITDLNVDANDPDGRALNVCKGMIALAIENAATAAFINSFQIVRGTRVYHGPRLEREEFEAKYFIDDGAVLHRHWEVPRDSAHMFAMIGRFSDEIRALDRMDYQQYNVVAERLVNEFKLIDHMDERSDAFQQATLDSALDFVNSLVDSRLIPGRDGELVSNHAKAAINSDEVKQKAKRVFGEAINSYIMALITTKKKSRPISGVKTTVIAPAEPWTPRTAEPLVVGETDPSAMFAIATAGIRQKPIPSVGACMISEAKAAKEVLKGLGLEQHIKLAERRIKEMDDDDIPFTEEQQSLMRGLELSLRTVAVGKEVTQTTVDSIAERLITLNDIIGATESNFMV